jgi:hypothetical protein
MINPLDLEEAFNEYIADLVHNAPDGIISINLPVLYELGLLNCEQVPLDQRKLTQYFHVIESNEKVTLFNDKFVIWILPRIVNEQPSTYTLVGIHEGKKPRLEMVFHTTGVYNTPNFVLRILEHFLLEIQENNDVLGKLEKKM